MRLVLALWLLLAMPALAADWGHYTNVRFGYAVDIPPGFSAGPAPANDDGRLYNTATATLRVFGGNILDGGFEDEVKLRHGYAADDGWSITYQVTTPDKASYSGRNGSRILYARMIALCGGTEFAMFELDYSTADMAKFDPVVSRLVGSLRATSGSCR